MRFTRITIIRSTRPEPSDINQELQWFGASLGLFGIRDKDKSCFRVFITLLKTLKTKENLSSDEIAERTKLTRGTVVHHLNHLMSSGIVISEKNTYSLRMDSLQQMVDHLKNDADDAWTRIKAVAKDIDQKLELK
jgi:predicted transcriptional regulator